MRVYAEMTCCKPERQKLGLGCDAAWMAGCLAARCASLPTLADRRDFAAQVSRVEQINQAGLQEWFKNEVQRLYKIKKAST